ncbi:hypothetical protein B0H19DRAFT_580577 [Mycena capillaripes]|nr:hypothetical protein B0H19DRAFT_580577 [Mycena capillaripes]
MYLASAAYLHANSSTYDDRHRRVGYRTRRGAEGRRGTDLGGGCVSFRLLFLFDWEHRGAVACCPISLLGHRAEILSAALAPTYFYDAFFFFLRSFHLFPSYQGLTLFLLCSRTTRSITTRRLLNLTYHAGVQLWDASVLGLRGRLWRRCAASTALVGRRRMGEAEEEEMYGPILGAAVSPGMLSLVQEGLELGILTLHALYVYSIGAGRVVARVASPSSPSTAASLSSTPSAAATATATSRDDYAYVARGRTRSRRDRRKRRRGG